MQIRGEGSRRTDESFTVDRVPMVLDAIEQKVENLVKTGLPPWSSHVGPILQWADAAYKRGEFAR